MLNLFRQNTFTAGIIVILFAALMRLPDLIHPSTYSLVYDAFLSNILFDFLQRFANPLLASKIVAMVLVMGQAVLLNYTVSKHSILYKDSFLPGFCFVLINSIYPEQDRLTSQLIANTFLLLVFMRLCYLYEAPKPLLLVLDSGMLLGAGMLFNYALLIFLPFILISVVVFTSFNLRYILVSLMGIILPVYFVLIFFYTTDRLHEMMEIGQQSIFQLQLKPLANSLWMYVPWFVLLPMSLFGAFNLQQNFFRNKVKTRRILQSIAVFALFGAACLFTETNGFIFSLAYFSVPVSIVMGYYLISTKRFWLKEILIWSVIGFAVYLRFA